MKTKRDKSGRFQKRKGTRALARRNDPLLAALVNKPRRAGFVRAAKQKVSAVKKSDAYREGKDLMLSSAAIAAGLIVPRMAARTVLGERDTGVIGPAFQLAAAWGAGKVAAGLLSPGYAGLVTAAGIVGAVLRYAQTKSGSSWTQLSGPDREQRRETIRRIMAAESAMPELAGYTMRTAEGYPATMPVLHVQLSGDVDPEDAHLSGYYQGAPISSHRGSW